MKHLIREALPTALSQAYNLGKYTDVTAHWEQMQKMQGMDSPTVIECQMLAAKSYQVLGNTEAANRELPSLAADIRTAPGAEAKYLLAQHAFDSDNIAEAKPLPPR